MFGVEIISGVNAKELQLVKDKIEKIKNIYDMKIHVTDCKNGYLFISTTIGNLRDNTSVKSPLIFEVASEPFNLPSIKKQFHLSISLVGD